MPKLLRPYIGLEARCRVVLRQLGEMFPNDAIFWHGSRKGGLGRLLASRIAVLAELLRCEASELRLDHDPALGTRRKVHKAGAHVGYDPPANSVHHLRYRPHAARHAASHDVKTRVRGDNGQLSDIALVKRNRRLEEREGTRPKSARTKAKEKRVALRAKRPTLKRPWPKRPFPKRQRKK